MLIKKYIICCKIVILIILEDQHRTEMELALSEVKSRNAFTIVISDCF